MEALELAREAYERCAWGEAFSQLSAAEPHLDAQHLELLAVAAHCLGRIEESVSAWERACAAHLEAGQPDSAAWAAAWCGFALLTQGDFSLGGGWVGRAQEICDQHRLDTAVRGFLTTQRAAGMMFAGDLQSAIALFEEGIRVAERFDNRNGLALGRLGLGQCLSLLGRPAESARVLDQVMLAVTSERLSPLVVGLAFCAAVDSCQRMLDVRRAQDWTRAFTRWCGEQPDLVPYRGNCLVHRAEILTLHGAWPEAYVEAERASTWPGAGPGDPVLGAAYYSLGELHRLRGEHAEAETAYKCAGLHGQETQPGLGLLRLAQGHAESASAAVRRALEETTAPVARAPLLRAHVEIALAIGDVPLARAAADELATVVEQTAGLLLRAQAQGAEGAVLLAEGAPSAALSVLRAASQAWHELDAPYERARVRVLIGRACQALGDADGAETELEAARWVFDDLGAAPDLAEVASLTTRQTEARPGGLSVREVQVLRLVAAGHSNRAVADALLLSEKTVHRHVSNIFTKLGVSSRAAATAYAFQHGLV